MIKIGNSRETACAAVGIDSRTLRIWLKRGTEGEEPYASLLDEMDEAEAQSIARGVATITAASKDDWRAAAWFLSRKKPMEWGERQTIEHAISEKTAASPTEAARLVREHFGAHAAQAVQPDEQEDTG